MSLSRSTLLALMFAALGAAPALAADPAPITVFVQSADGRTAIVPIDEALADHLVNSPHAKKLTTGVVIISRGGQAYEVEDHKMASGETMMHTVLNANNENPGFWR